MCFNIKEKKQQILFCLSTLFVFFLFSTVLLFCFLKNNDKFSNNRKEQLSSVCKDFMWSKKRNCTRVICEDFTGSKKRNVPQTFCVDFIRSKTRNIPQIQLSGEIKIKKRNVPQLTYQDFLWKEDLFLIKCRGFILSEQRSVFLCFMIC